MNFRRIILLISFFVFLLIAVSSQSIYFLVFFSIMTLMLLPFHKWWDSSSILLLFFSVFYVIMLILSRNSLSGFLTLAYLVSPVAFYRLGNYLMFQFDDEHNRFTLLLAIAMAYLLYLFVLTIVDISIVGIINNDRTLLGDSANNSTAATLYGLMASFGIGCVGATFAKNLTTLKRMFFISIVGLAMLVVVHLINRGGLVIFATTTILSIILASRKHTLKLLMYVVTLSFIIWAIIHFDVINSEILSAYEKRNDSSGSEVITAGGRTALWMNSMQKLLTNPFGWQQKLYAHNLWIDMARLGGWISLIPFLIATYLNLRNIIFALRNSKSTFIATIFVLNIALLLSASIEPVLEGSIHFFCMMMLVWGMSSFLYKETRYNIYN